MNERPLEYWIPRFRGNDSGEDVEQHSRGMIYPSFAIHLPSKD